MSWLLALVVFLSCLFPSVSVSVSCLSVSVSSLSRRHAQFPLDPLTESDQKEFNALVKQEEQKAKPQEKAAMQDDTKGDTITTKYQQDTTIEQQLAAVSTALSSFVPSFARVHPILLKALSSLDSSPNWGVGGSLISKGGSYNFRITIMGSKASKAIDIIKQTLQKESLSSWEVLSPFPDAPFLIRPNTVMLSHEQHRSQQQQQHSSRHESLFGPRSLYEAEQTRGEGSILAAQVPNPVTAAPGAAPLPVLVWAGSTLGACFRRSVTIPVLGTYQRRNMIATTFHGNAALRSNVRLPLPGAATPYAEIGKIHSFDYAAGLGRDVTFVSLEWPHSCICSETATGFPTRTLDSLGPRAGWAPSVQHILGYMEIMQQRGVAMSLEVSLARGLMRYTVPATPLISDPLQTQILNVNHWFVLDANTFRNTLLAGTPFGIPINGDSGAGLYLVQNSVRYLIGIHHGTNPQQQWIFSPASNWNNRIPQYYDIC